MSRDAPAAHAPEPTPDPAPDPAESRRLAIRAAAFEVFGAYGYKRTSMEDIAKAAGMSRAALYLHYRNKQDIFRAMVVDYFDATESRMRAALQPGTAPVPALRAAFAAKMGRELQALMESPHGEELLDANQSACPDLVRDGDARLAAVLADWISGEARAGRVALSAFGGDAEALSRIIIAAINGQKDPRAGFAAFSAAADQLARLFGRAMTP